MIVAETPATIVVSQINPSPPELSTAFPQATLIAGGWVGGNVGSGVGGSVGGNVGGAVAIGGTVGGTVGATGDGDGGGKVGGMVSGVTVGVMVGPAVGAPVTVGFTVAVEPLGATRDGRDSEGRGEGDHAGSDGRMIGTMAERLGLGKGVGVGWTTPTSAKPDAIPPSQVVTTIATKGVR